MAVARRLKRISRIFVKKVRLSPLPPCSDDGAHRREGNQEVSIVDKSGFDGFAVEDNLDKICWNDEAGPNNECQRYAANGGGDAKPCRLTGDMLTRVQWNAQFRRAAGRRSVDQRLVFRTSS
ncbi:MAG: hypothetical protein RLN89_08640 [Parvibaculum sp.]